MKSAPSSMVCMDVRIPAGKVMLDGQLCLPPEASGVVLFAHGSGSSRHSPRNQFVAEIIREASVGTLLFDLLTRDEEAEDDRTRALRFDIDLLARRLVAATRWLLHQEAARGLSVGFFGASTGGGAALMAAAQLGAAIAAVVSRGGRPDLAGSALPQVHSPTLLIVGGYDGVVIDLNRRAYDELRCPKELVVVPRASHLFAEPGKLEQVARLSADWFQKYFTPSA
ncbi:hydrolase [Verrucomicrobiaceae bacterium SCGC AG-212-N21]|nr:hydrolase [Verrucomicrobiaceae bacterium SCGC AG-212-N21]